MAINPTHSRQGVNRYARTVVEANRPAARATGVDSAARSGFTLVEMMISVTLVLLMMLMFAEVYGLATDAVSKQKGIAENDQKSRILSSVIRSDLENRTFRVVYPFASELTYGGNSARRGYFSISENNPDSDLDDVLQFTVQFNPANTGTLGQRHYGKANSWPTDVKDPISGTDNVPVTLHDAANMPDYDDGINGNRAGASTTAEIAYFVRNGNLYRSVLLVRNPYYDFSDSANPTTDNDWLLAVLAQPSTYGDPIANYSLFSKEFPTAGSSTTRSFWNDFDFSAFRHDLTATMSPVGTVQFHDASASLEK